MVDKVETDTRRIDPLAGAAVAAPKFLIIIEKLEQKNPEEKLPSTFIALLENFPDAGNGKSGRARGEAFVNLYFPKMESPWDRAF